MLSNTLSFPELLQDSLEKAAPTRPAPRPPCRSRRGAGSVAPSQPAGRGAAGFSGAAGMGRGPELGFLPSLTALPPPAAWEQMCCLCQPWQAPLSFHQCSAKPRAWLPQQPEPRPLLPLGLAPRAAAPVSLGMEAESSAHSACLAVTLPLFSLFLSLPPSRTGLFVGKFNADEQLGLRAGRPAARRRALLPRGGWTQACPGRAWAASLQQGAFAGSLFPATLRTPPAGLRTRGEMGNHRDGW